MELGVYQAGGSSVHYGAGTSSSGYVAAPNSARADSLAAAIFISAGGQSDLSHENEPTLYIEPNRTSAIDDIRSVVIYIFIITIFFGFFLILPGIRNEKFPTFLCITTSLVVTSIVLIALFGTTWHVAEAPISAAYKSFSRDRIQGDLNVRIGLQSVNISLVAHKYYLLHAGGSGETLIDYTTTTTTIFTSGGGGSLFSASPAEPSQDQQQQERANRARPATQSSKQQEQNRTQAGRSKRRRSIANGSSRTGHEQQIPVYQAIPVIRKSKVDINYNERFYWIEPDQMRQEYRSALERGLPYPILTVVEYLSQDEANFNWSRQYRAAGYYTTINLWLSICLCVLMFSLHCAAPRYGIYSMQLLGCLLLFTNLTYATFVPRGERELVIPFEGQSLRFRFGWNFWLVLIGGCLSLLVGSVIVIIDNLFPNFIFTTVLDADFDSQHCNYKKDRVISRSASTASINGDKQANSGTKLPAQVQPRLSQRHNSSSNSSSNSNSNNNNMRRPQRNLALKRVAARTFGPAETGQLHRRRDDVMAIRKEGQIEEGSFVDVRV